MANTSRINGFRPVKHVTGAPYNGQCNIYAVNSSDATALFVGDPVKFAADGNSQGIQYVTKATTGAGVVGVVVGIVNAKLDPVSGGLTTGSISLDVPIYRAASTAGYVLVADADDLIYEVEAVGAAGVAYSFAVADIGQNADLYSGTGSSTTGASGCGVDMSTKNTTATLQWKVVGVVQRPDNEVTGNYTKVLVKVNNHQLAGGTGTAGV